MEHQGYQKIDGQQCDDYWDTQDVQTIKPPSFAKSGVHPEPVEGKSTAATNQAPKTISLDEFNKVVTAIDEAINKKYVRKNIWGNEYQLNSFTLKEKDFFDIIEIIHQHSTDYDYSITIKLIEKLLGKNDYFEQAFNHFIDLAHEYIKNIIDIDIGDTVERILCQTQSVQFNALPRHIRTYFMVYARRHKINHSYDIVLKGHQDCITYFDIHPGTHRAATSSYDKTLRLWDLTTGKCIRIFPGDNNLVHSMKFSSDGARLVTITNYAENYSTIKLWDTQSAKILNNRQVNIPVYEFNYQEYAHDYHNGTLTIRPLSRQECSSGTLTWSYLYKTREPAYNPNDESTLTITKLNCCDLYIYEQAIKNNPLKMNADKIDQSKLTDYEKDRLHKLLITEQTQHKLAQK